MMPIRSILLTFKALPMNGLNFLQAAFAVTDFYSKRMKLLQPHKYHDSTIITKSHQAETPEILGQRRHHANTFYRPSTFILSFLLFNNINRISNQFLEW